MRNYEDVMAAATTSRQPKKAVEELRQARVQTPVQLTGASGDLLRLQRRYGNRLVQRVVNLSRRSESGAVSPGDTRDRATTRHQHRVQMEPAFGTDFGGVRVPTDGQNDSLNHALRVRTMATGQDTLFKQGKFSPGRFNGRQSLTRKLTYVAQRNGEEANDMLSVGQSNNQHALGVKSTLQRQTAGTPKDPKQVAHDLIATFDAEKGSGNAFSKLSKADIVSGLRTRVNNPQSINQAGLNACGPASAAYIFASSDPAGYVQMAIDLFKTGVAKYHEYTVKAGSDLRSHGPNDYKWPSSIPDPVDWMVLSSLRDAENWFYDFEGSPSEDFSAITMPGEMQEWLKNFLGFKKVEDDTNLVSTKGVEHLQQVVNAKYRAGNIVVLFINANLVSGTTKKSAKEVAKKSGAKGEKILAAFPNHFVVLKSEATVDLPKDNIEMKVWTWGGTTHISCNKEVFESNYYGAIFATK